MGSAMGSAVGSAGGWSGAVAAKAEQGRRQSMTDSEILANLQQAVGWVNTDMGGDGNCLFLSLAPQAAAADLTPLLGRGADWARLLGGDIGQRWDAMPVRERAHMLRRIAMLDEREFLADLKFLRDSGAPLPDYARWRTGEFYKDMAEEFISSGVTELAEGVSRWDLNAVYRRVKDLVRDTPEAKVLDFVLQHAEQYMSITGREGNWAGSSELVALASALNRPCHAYGNDKISQETVRLDAAGRVTPYLDASPPPPAAPGGVGGPAGTPGSPLRVFQKNGGGHYQMLA